MAETRPPTPNELRWALRKLNQLIKSHDELTARVAELEKPKTKKAEA